MPADPPETNKASGLLQMGQAKNGSPILLYQNLALSSRFNPENEAQRFWESQDLSHAHVILWFGPGSFYHILEVLERKAEVQIILVDPLPRGQSSIKACAPSKPLWDHARIHWADLNSYQSILHQYSGASILIASSPPYKKQFPQEWQALQTKVTEWVEIDRVNHNTLRSHAPIWYRNIVKNCRKPIRGIGSWQGRFSGARALILAAGPSLDGFLDQQKKLQDQSLAGWDLLIAVDTTARHMQGRGIIPDFWVSTDGQYWNSRHLERAPEPRIGLLTDVCASPRVASLWPEKTFYAASHNPISADIFQGELGSLRSGGSVATTAWEWARYLGVASITFGGLDLSYPGGKTHSRGSFFEKDAISQSNRLHGPVEGIWQMYRSGKLRPATSFKGQMVQTDLRMLIYKRWFEYALGDPQAPGTFNANPGALAIEGMKTGLAPAIATGRRLEPKQSSLHVPEKSFDPGAWLRHLKAWLKDFQRPSANKIFPKDKVLAPVEIRQTLQAFFPSLGWPGKDQNSSTWQQQMQAFEAVAQKMG
jgi:hypothetical protein